jgi:regulatory protein
MDLLARREHSPAELRRKLADRDFSPGEIEVTLEALIREGLLSEARFLESFVDSQVRRGHGPVWIRAELEKRGIAGEEVAAALAAADRDWTALAREVRAKRFGAGRPADFRERARQMRFLQYRGFTGAQVREALGSAGADAGDDVPDDAPDDGFTAD